MKLGHAADEIGYTGNLGTTSVYEVTLERRVVMRVLCDVSSPDRRIAITKPDGTGFQRTAGVFNMKQAEPQLIEGPDGTPLGVAPATPGHVNSQSVYSYVVPRLHVLIARLLLPLPAQES